MKADNQTMDRQIPVKEQRTRKMRKILMAVAIVAVVSGIAAWLGMQMMPSVNRKSLVVSEVDRGTIDVSVSATGRVVPAFEEVIISPISSQILEVYAHSGDHVEAGTPLLRLDLQSTETDYAKALDEREIRRQQTAQLQANTETQLSDRRMQIKVEEMKVSQLEAQLRNELYLDSLGSGTRDRVRQAETALRTAQLQLNQLRQQYQNEQRVKQADMRMQQLQNSIFEKGVSEKRRTLNDAKICSPRQATLTYINSEVGSTVGAGQKVAIRRFDWKTGAWTLGIAVPAFFALAHILRVYAEANGTATVTVGIPEFVATPGRKVVIDYGTDKTFATKTTQDVATGQSTVQITAPAGAVIYYRLRATTAQ